MIETAIDLVVLLSRHGGYVVDGNGNLNERLKAHWQFRAPTGRNAAVLDSALDQALQRGWVDDVSEIHAPDPKFRLTDLGKQAALSAREGLRVA
ncbi:MAG: hypothetical protein AAGF84_03885 [Planctomycetota bacterium]